VSVVRVLSAVLLSLVPLLALACEDDGRCGDGESCRCQDENYCFFECEGDGCDMSCNSVVSCGAVCEDDCSVECHDMKDCTASCGDDCTIDCHNTEECGAICGPHCDFECHDATKCGVRVGSNSTVDCTNVASCAVECEGSCRVTCQNVSDDCTVRCSDGDDAVTCSGNVRACGSCP
jgi:hypothetical protein